MSKCRPETITSSHGPTHLGNSMCLAVAVSRPSNCTNMLSSMAFISPTTALARSLQSLFILSHVSLREAPSLLFFSPWQLVLCMFGWNKHSFPGHARLSPRSQRPAQGLELCMSWCGFHMGNGNALEGRLWKGLRTRLDSFTLMPHWGVPSPWRALTDDASLYSISGTIWSSHYNMTSGAFEVPAAGAKAL